MHLAVRHGELRTAIETDAVGVLVGLMHLAVRYADEDGGGTKFA